MSIYASFGMFDGDEDGYPAPIIYQRSHVMPAVADPRGGELGLGLIPGFVIRDGRDRTGREFDPYEGSDDEGVWPFLRVSLRPVGWAEGEDTVVLDRAQVEQLRDHLSDWLLRCDDPEAWLQQHEQQPSGRGPIVTAPDAEPPPQAAVVAEDLRALAEVVPFDEATRELLELAAELLDPEDQP